ncbi:MAG: hypothetical protein NUV67_02085, partial [archaeon]|nr:hypothetical protein [archaeon]
TIVYWLIFAEIVLFLTSMTNIILVSLAGEILVVYYLISQLFKHKEFKRDDYFSYPLMFLIFNFAIFFAANSVLNPNYFIDANALIGGLIITIIMSVVVTYISIEILVGRG